jgi:hypothetical protein
VISGTIQVARRTHLNLLLTINRRLLLLTVMSMHLVLGYVLY